MSIVYPNPERGGADYAHIICFVTPKKISWLRPYFIVLYSNHATVELKEIYYSGKAFIVASIKVSFHKRRLLTLPRLSEISEKNWST